MMRAVSRISVVFAASAYILGLPLAAAPAADHGSFTPARVAGNQPGCTGTARATAATAGQYTAQDMFESKAVAAVYFDGDPSAMAPAPDSGSAGPATPCTISSTVTMRNLNTGETLTRTGDVRPGYPHGFTVDFVSAGPVAVQVSTNPEPAQIVVDVPAPRPCPPNPDGSHTC